MDATIIPLFRWSGLFVGFLVDGCLFEANGGYFGWEDRLGRIWRDDGSYLGERVDQHYVLRRSAWTTPVPQPRRVPPVTPELPLPPPNRSARPPRPGFEDALGRFGLMPTAAALHGDWANAHEQMRMLPDGHYVQTAAGQTPNQGRWELRGNLYLTPDTDATMDASAPASGGSDDMPAMPQRLVFQVLRFDGQSLTLRQVTAERSLPFTLERRGPATSQ